MEPEAIALIARLAGGGMRDAESMLDQVLVSSADPISAGSVADLLGLADVAIVDDFIAALVAGDVLGGIRLLDALETDGRDLVAFSEQLVTRLREVLVERLSASSPGSRAGVRPLTEAARRLTGIDASRSGLGGYRWQLELCLLAAAEGVSGQRPAPAAGPAPASRSCRRGRLRGRQPPAPQRTPPAAAPASQPRPPGASAPGTPSRTPPEPSMAAATPRSATPAKARPVERPAAPSDPEDILAIRAAWPSIVAAIGANPANRPLVSSCRPVEFRDGFLVLGFPEDQAFMRDIAERKRRVLEDGIAAVVGRPVAVRCVVTNLELVEPVDSGEDDLVAQARRVFDGELAGVEDID